MNRPLRTVQIGIGWGSQNLGGADRVFAELALNLGTEGIDFQGVVPGPPDLELRSNGRIHGAAPAHSGTLSRVLGSRRFVRYLTQTSEVNLVATHFALYAFGVLHVLRRYPHVVHFHGPWASESTEEGRSRLVAAAMRFIERRVYDSADRVIVLSEAFAQVAMRDYKIPEQKIRIVPGSADIHRFAIVESRLEARERLGWPLDRTIMISVRRLSARMGLDRLIAAMSSIRHERPDVLLYVGGKGHMLQTLQDQVAALGLSRNVKFIGFIPDDELALAYCAADINLVPTTSWEGFGLVAVEALAAGTPSMVTPVGGLPEVVSNLTRDLMFESCEPADLARGIIEALSGVRKLPSREQCREYAAVNFASTTMAKRTAEIYRELVSTWQAKS